MKRIAIAALVGFFVLAPLLPTRVAVAGADDAGDYRLAMVAMSDFIWAAIRYNVVTGESWAAVSGKWVPIKDGKEVARGHYKVYMVALKSDWGAVRLDTDSGRAWRAVEGAWVEISGP
jgi:hypothetical protein